MVQLPALATGLASTEPGRTPDVYQRISATPDMFGATAGREMQAGAAALGHGAQNLASGLEKAGAHFDDVAGDEAANQFQARVGKILNGDPDAVGPDGQPSDLGYMALKGRNALDARKTVEDSIRNLQKEIAGGLKTPRQQAVFNNFATKYGMATAAKVGSHATRESQVWYKEVNDSTANLALQQIAANPDNPQELAIGVSDYVNAQVKNAELAGAKPGDEVWKSTIADAKRTALKTQLQAMATTQPAKALEILERPANRQIAGVDYDNLSTAFRTRASEQVGLTAAERALAYAAGAPPPQPTPGQQNAIYTAILGQESNDNPNAPTSIDGAVGPGQIRPETFNRFAQPGEIITKAEDNRRVAQRIVETYERKYAGDPQRVAVAYFSGEGNVAPEGSPTPWKRDVVDGNGKSVSSYVDDVNARLGGSLRARIAESKATAVASIMTDPTLDPKARSVALTRINQQYQTLQIAAEADKAAKDAAAEKAADGYVKGILGGQTVGMLEQIRNDAALTSSKREHLANMLQQHLKSETDADLKTYGPGFYDVWRRIHAPQGDPNRITDPTQLFAMVGPQTDVNGQTVPGRLSVAGVAKLAEEIRGKRTPEGEAASAMKTQFFSNARKQITGSNDYIKDPKGDENFLRFQAQVYPLIEQGMKDGKSPAALFNPDSPDYVGKAVSGFKRTPAQIMADMESANKTTETFAPQSIGDVQKALMDKKISRDEARRILLEKGWAAEKKAAPAVQGPSVPISQ